jgi:Polyketide cyclase / dehydrase and lipid transport
MARPLEQLWDPRGVTGRRAYLVWGVGLMALKYNLDRLIAGVWFGTIWTWRNYWAPFDTQFNRLSSDQLWFVGAMLLSALPFITAGVVLTIRRLRDANWPRWFVAFFFLPVLNIVFFASLVSVPGRSAVAETGLSTWWARLAEKFKVLGPAASASMAIILTVVLVVPMAAAATMVFKTYGWGVFVALPFCLGMFASLFYSAAEPRSWKECVGVAMLAFLICGLALIAVAVEGLICVLMAVPVAGPLVVLGATAGYFLQQSEWRTPSDTARLYAVGWLALPLSFMGEAASCALPAQYSVTTTVDISATPETVWDHVVQFSQLPPPTDLFFRAGIAYPIRARIWGHGVGAVRHCEFSTGPFVEPITTWDEPRLLAFDVTEQPHPMRELSPYRELDTPHLNGFFQSRHGQFLLTRLADGSTRLSGTTWYTQSLWPGSYWRLWSDYLVHKIHSRVLEHIKAETEARPGTPKVG